MGCGLGTRGEVGFLLGGEGEESVGDLLGPFHLWEPFGGTGSTGGGEGFRPAVPGLGGGVRGGRDLDVVDQRAVGVGGGWEGVGASRLFVDDEGQGVISGGQTEGGEKGGFGAGSGGGRLGSAGWRTDELGTHSCIILTR